ncbi:YugN family protein [Bacillaceae bacterium S4-13-58]
MRFEETGIDGKVIDLKPLDHLMEKLGFVRAGQWDYERVTYDYKFESPIKNVTYYLRVQGYALEGDVDRRNAVIKLLTPILGKHYYPHGVEYGEEEDFPENVQERSKSLLKEVSEKLEAFHQ